jgi:3',5'-cyclic AMP phosphodiesterase CpdA
MAFVLAHLSDPHLPLPRPRLAELFGKRVTGYINWRRKRRFIHDRVVLDALTADLATRKADHIAVTGDIANIAAEAEFAPGATWLKSLGSAHNVSFVPGNHDIYVAAGRRYAVDAWGDYMSGDSGGIGFPYVRRRGPLALIGLSTGVPTLPGMATGTLGARQADALTALLRELKKDGAFRVVLIHHPPVSEAGWHKRLTDAARLKHAIAAEGAELLIHGHDHRRMLNWLEGPRGTRVAAVGVPSASASPATAKQSAAYNLYAIDGVPGAWSCQVTSRGVGRGGNITETQLMTLFG